MGIKMEFNKIDIVSKRINNLNVHIEELEYGLLNYIEEDIEGKPTRQSVLDDLKLKKAALSKELEMLQRQINDII